MLQPAQIRAARGLLGWRQDDLAGAANVGVATIRRIEGKEGSISGNISTLLRIEKAFDRAGISFIVADEEGGIGVRIGLSGSKSRVKKKS